MEQRRTFRWHRISDPLLRPAIREAVEARLLAVLQSWEHTPHMRGQRRRGAATDCVNFVAGVLDELYGNSPMPVLKTPIDVGLHSRSSFWRINKAIMEAYPHRVLRGREVEVEPGDLVLVRRGPGPRHLFIVGPEPCTLWNSDPKNGVVKTGLAQATNCLRVWRLLEKDTWHQS